MSRQADPDDRPDDEPLAFVTTAQDARNQPGDDDPGEEVEGRGGEQVPDGKHERGDRRAQCREALREAAAAHLARDEPGEEHDRHGGQRRDQAKAGQRVAEERGGRSRDGRRQRRLIDVAPIEVLGRHEEVQLVSVIAVLLGGDEQQEQREPGGAQDRQPGNGGAVVSHGPEPVSPGSAVIGSHPSAAAWASTLPMTSGSSGSGITTVSAAK